jgi:lysophospholipase L1-like esterase
MAQSTVGLIPKWKATTAYTTGQWVVNPSGDIVVAKSNFTSGTSYSATNWDNTAAYTALQALIATKFPDLGRITTGIIDDYKTQGIYKVWTTTDATNLQLPLPFASRIVNVAIGSYVQQSQITIDTPQRQIHRLWNGSAWGAWAIQSPYMGNIANTAGADKALTVDGLYWVTSGTVATTLGLPDVTYGTLERLTYGAANIVRLTWRPNATGRIYESTYESGIWSPWRKLGGKGTKNVAMALTTSGPIATTTQTAVHARVPFKIAVDGYRYRFYFRNYNYRMWTSYPGSLSFLGAVVGSAETVQGELTGQFTAAPTSIQGATTTNVNAGVLTTSWINSSVKKNDPYLLGFAYTSPAGQENFASVGGGWISSNTGSLASQIDSGLVKTKQVPLDIWMEIEVDADTRVIAYVGDSLTAGVSADLPVYDSWANRHALKQGAIPMMYGFSGDSFGSYTNSTQPKLTKWAAQARPDAVVLALGSNNIYQANTIAAMRSSFAVMYDLVIPVTSKNVYLTTILPRYADASAYEQTRKDWNEILKTELLGNAVMCFEPDLKFVDSSGNNLDVKWGASPTDFHLSRQGYARFAAQVPAL